ncbi:MAG: SRPBCC family protein [Anaerolineales bacterium]
MNIDTNTPMSARREIIIEAPIEKVWNVQTDIEGWPAWQSDITSAIMDGELKAGTIFRWNAKGLGIVSTLHTVERNRQIGWTGLSLGMSAIPTGHSNRRAMAHASSLKSPCLAGSHS